MALWCGHAVLPFPSCGLVSFSIHWFSGFASIGWCHSLSSYFCHFCSFLSCLKYIGHVYGCHALVVEFFWCIPPFPFALICLILVWVCLLRVLSLLWPSLDLFLPFPMLHCLWSGLLVLVTGVSCAHLFPVCLASPCFRFWFVFPFNLRGSSLGSYFPSG